MNRLQERSMISSDDIYRDLLEKIVNLEYMPGDLLSEHSLCETYRCTRHMVRGAFVMLRQKGLLEVYPQRGSYVSLIDLQLIGDILFLREAAETAAAMQVMTDDDLAETAAKQMQKQIEKQKEAADKNDIQAYFEADDSFHQILMKAAGRQAVRALLEDEYIHLRRWRNLEVRSTKRIPVLIREHKAICKALRRQDREKTAALLHEHFDTLKYAEAIGDPGRDTYFR